MKCIEKYMEDHHIKDYRVLTKIEEPLATKCYVEILREQEEENWLYIFYAISEEITRPPEIYRLVPWGKILDEEKIDIEVENRKRACEALLLCIKETGWKCIGVLESRIFYYAHPSKPDMLYQFVFSGDGTFREMNTLGDYEEY